MNQRDLLRSEREAEWKRLAAVAEQAREAQRAAFQESLTDDLRAAIEFGLKPIRLDINPFGAELQKPVYRSDFFQSLAWNYEKNGFLSEKQLAAVVKAYQRHLDDQKALKEMKPLAVGDKFQWLVVFDSISIGLEDAYHKHGGRRVAICRFVGPDGRKYKLKTAHTNSLANLELQQKTGEMMVVTSTVKWLAPEMNITVLGGTGTRIKRVLE